MHDASWWNSEGYDFVEELCKRRDDLVYLGMYGAFLNIGNVKAYVMHPDGGVAYARSYKMQKIIEKLPPESKPHILLVGHYHVTCHMPKYRNVEGIQVGCFQAQTQYLKRKALNPDISALVLTINQNTAGLESIETKWRHWYVPIENDF